MSQGVETIVRYTRLRDALKPVAIYRVDTSEPINPDWLAITDAVLPNEGAGGAGVMLGSSDHPTLYSLSRGACQGRSGARLASLDPQVVLRHFGREGGPGHGHGWARIGW